MSDVFIQNKTKPLVLSWVLQYMTVYLPPSFHLSCLSLHMLSFSFQTITPNPIHLNLSTLSSWPKQSGDFVRHHLVLSVLIRFSSQLGLRLDSEVSQFQKTLLTQDASLLRKTLLVWSERCCSLPIQPGLTHKVSCLTALFSALSLVNSVQQESRNCLSNRERKKIVSLQIYDLWCLALTPSAWL